MRARLLEIMEGTQLKSWCGIIKDENEEEDPKTHLRRNAMTVDEGIAIGDEIEEIFARLDDNGVTGPSRGIFRRY